VNTRGKERNQYKKSAIEIVYSLLEKSSNDYRARCSSDEHSGRPDCQFCILPMSSSDSGGQRLCLVVELLLQYCRALFIRARRIQLKGPGVRAHCLLWSIDQQDEQAE